jgi:hypothetical protein
MPILQAHGNLRPLVESGGDARISTAEKCDALEYRLSVQRTQGDAPLRVFQLAIA